MNLFLLLLAILHYTYYHEPFPMMVQYLHNLTFVSNHSQNQKLWQACYSGDLAAVNDALGKGADINWNNPNHQVDL